MEAADRVRGGAGTDGWLSSSRCSVLCCKPAVAAVADDTSVLMCMFICM
jgi:hypothetical protein